MKPSRIRALFLLALALTLFFALDPRPPRLPIDRFGDKFEHMLAFAVLAMLARLGFRSLGGLAILVRLSLFGAAIEVLQAIPMLNRDSDWHDWVADTLAIAVTLLFLKILGISAAARS